jgi:hypothetical protein
MQITDDRLKELQRIYKEAVGEEITLAETREMAQRLISLFQILGRPLRDDDEPPSSLSDSPARTEP